MGRPLLLFFVVAGFALGFALRVLGLPLIPWPLVSLVALAAVAWWIQPPDDSGAGGG